MEYMEYINKIEIQGIVGSVRTQTLFGSKVSNMSVHTDHMYTNKEGYVVAETMWHNVVVWGSNTSTDLDKVEKGTPVRVVGRMRTTMYTGADGISKTYHEILASEFSIVSDV